MTIITLTTDFGLQDTYVGTMKGVILSIDPSARIVDLTHQITPQDTLSAVREIASSYRYFPAGTIHVVVVDPGVGGSRDIIALKVDGHTFLAPDNGIAGHVAQLGRCQDLVRIENSALFLKPLSATFHGRDIFAPVAANLSTGYPMEKLGPPVDQHRLILQANSTPEADDQRIDGTIVKVDRFGNLISDIDTQTIEAVAGNHGGANLLVQVRGTVIHGISRIYGDVPHGRPLALVGSSGYLEIAANCGNAEHLIDAHCGDRIAVRLAGTHKPNSSGTK